MALSLIKPIGIEANIEHRILNAFGVAVRAMLRRDTAR